MLKGLNVRVPAAAAAAAVAVVGIEGMLRLVLKLAPLPPLLANSTAVPNGVLLVLCIAEMAVAVLLLPERSGSVILKLLPDSSLCRCRWGGTALLPPLLLPVPARFRSTCSCWSCCCCCVVWADSSDPPPGEVTVERAAGKNKDDTWHFAKIRATVPSSKHSHSCRPG